MDIKKVLSEASAASSINEADDPDIGRLLRLAEVTQRKLDQIRAGDVSAAHKSDDELITRAADDMEHDAGFSMEEARASYGRLSNDLCKKSMVGALPLLLRLRGRPYTLEDHFPMEPIFRTEMPVQFLLRCGRQVSKSTTFAAQGVIQSGCTPFFNSLFVTPLFEQCRRFSTNYVRPFVNDSP